MKEKQRMQQFELAEQGAAPCPTKRVVEVAIKGSMQCWHALVGSVR